MNRRQRLVGMIMSLGLLAVPTFAQDAAAPTQKSDPGLAAVHAQMKAAADAVDAPDQFGTACCQITQIPASSFQVRNSGTAWTYATNGYIYATTNPIGDQIAFWATVTLPSGVAIRYLDLYYNDLDAGNDITATIRAYNGTGSPGFSDVVSVASGGSGGYGYNFSSIISHTVDNDVLLGGSQYTVVIFLPASPNSNLQFKAVDIWWNRQVSPAPGVATFADVPTGNPQFQFVEALVASGITAGCGAPNYCPNNPVTRGQMAVFLAKALGLYWPY